MQQKVIADNTVLSNFASVDRLDLLEKVFGEIYITLEVYAEVDNGIKKGYLFQKQTKQIVDSGYWIHITSLKKKELNLYEELAKIVDFGEASCLAIAKERKWLFLTDDDKARTISKTNNIQLSGTVGVIRSAVIRNLIHLFEAEQIHQVMIKNGYYSPIKLIADII